MLAPPVRPLSRSLLFLTLAAVPFAACECDTDVNVIAPQIAVDVCNDPQITVREELLGGVRDCLLEFESQPITVRTKKEIKISNPSPILLTIFSAEFTEDSDPAFEIEPPGMPDEIADGQSAFPFISYRPLVEGTQRGTLVIRSDAENLAEDEDVRIEIVGTGFDDGVPDIVVTPLECDFGRVPVASETGDSGVGQCRLQIENRGQRDLVFDEVNLLFDGFQVPPESAWEPSMGADGDAAPPFSFVGRAPSRGDALPPPADEPGDTPQNIFDLTVRFVPDVLGNFQGQLRIQTNDPDTPEVIVPLSGIGAPAPSCGAGILSVNGVPAASNPTVEPLDDVILTAESSEPSTLDGAISQVRWRIVDQPPGSTAILTNPTGTTTGFTFADGVQGVDLAGRYRVAASVVDDLGTESVNECEVEFEAIPTDTILVQLSWDTSFGDMDLHFIKKDESDQFCASSGLDLGGGVAEPCGTENACYYGNCKATSSSRPDWDNDSINGSDGDPSLDIDDLCGFGPENINIDLASPGEYLVGVDFFGFTGCSGSGSVGNTLRVYLFGQLYAEYFRDLENGDWWEVAIVHWSDDPTEVCVESIETGAIDCPFDGT
jgi:hypothetical protein